jgi:secondary thiamine-phosphate synthase enzyme
MAVFNKKISIEMEAEKGSSDITPEVRKAVAESKIMNGIAVVFIVGSTGAVSTIEYEPGLLKDVPRALERIAPSNIDYDHHNTWHDDNGKSHVRSTIIGCSLTVPFIDGELVLGQWQQIIAMNLDTSPRKREIIIQIMGENEE